MKRAIEEGFPIVGINRDDADAVLVAVAARFRADAQDLAFLRSTLVALASS